MATKYHDNKPASLNVILPGWFLKDCEKIAYKRRIPVAQVIRQKLDLPEPGNSGWTSRPVPSVEK